MDFVELFVSEEVGNAFVFGMVFCSIILFVPQVLVPFVDFFWDWFRRKMGYPVSRYVHWVKEQNEVNNK